MKKVFIDSQYKNENIRNFGEFIHSCKKYELTKDVEKSDVIIINHPFDNVSVNTINRKGKSFNSACIDYDCLRFSCNDTDLETIDTYRTARLLNKHVVAFGSASKLIHLVHGGGIYFDTDRSDFFLRNNTNVVQLFRKDGSKRIPELTLQRENVPLQGVVFPTEFWNSNCLNFTCLAFNDTLNERKYFNHSGLVIGECLKNAVKSFDFQFDPSVYIWKTGRTNEYNRNALCFDFKLTKDKFKYCLNKMKRFV